MRRSAKAALDELVQERLVKDRGYKGEVFGVTHQGYETAANRPRGDV